MEWPLEDGAEDATQEFSVAVSMRGPAAHLAVRGTVDDEATRTLGVLLDRLPAADVTEVVIDVTETVGDPAVIENLTDVVSGAARAALAVTVAVGSLGGERAESPVPGDRCSGLS